MGVAAQPEGLQYPALSRNVMLCVQFTALAGLIVLLDSLATWESPDLLKYSAFLTVGIFSSGAAIDVPSVTGSFSLTFLFVLFGTLELTRPETVLLAALMTVGHCLTQSPRVRPALTVFQTGSAVLAAAVAHGVYHGPWLAAHHADPSVRLGVATMALFLLNSVPASLILALEKESTFLDEWRSRYMWLLTYYVGGAATAQIASVANQYVGWQTVLLTGPVMYLIYRTYRLYLERLEGQKMHAEDMSSLHLRTIEALALAIEAKDHTTHDHIQRVQVYAMELAKELKLSVRETDALRAAALLHDIGKLAVPEHIISKPGRLTPEEFEKMKIHPLVGAEILERVQFPYPVVPIVRAHHEKWDGSGYPFGIAGERIPIGARIIAAVDCLDALASDRQYRRALPLEEAMKVVTSESGKAFDPRVVEVLAQRYVEWERMAQEKSGRVGKLSTEAKVAKGASPGAGFESTGKVKPVPQKAAGAPTDFLTSIAAARQEVQALFEISQDLGNSLSLDETLSVLAVRLRKIIPHHSLAIWIQREGSLVPEYVTGEDYRMFSSLEIPLGQGLSGWVAHTRKPIVNGNPSVESSYLGDKGKSSVLHSAVAVPLEGMTGVVGVLSLYHLDRDAFTKDHLRILLAISPKIGMSIENALRFRQVESSATTDFLTGLPNARSLFLQLDAEISRAKRNVQPLAVLVVDLDGFKQINDRFGHLDGNKLLRAVGSGLKGACREYDSVARMGGDEFVVLLPGLRPGDTDSKVHVLQEMVAQTCHQIFGEKLLTASVGVANYPGDGSDAEQLLAEADRRMYKQKRDRKQGGPEAERRKLWEAQWDVTTVH
ncbi:MAG TPA: diguanylate cyclase [Bryobacteraceae bacterium]|jgi:diguanylate cyclase (GGDEF)-like protein/putative nucleotidyltransferase with HDIG domain